MSPVNPARMSPQPGVGVSGELNWAMMAMITLSEIGEHIRQQIRSFIIQGVDFLIPLVDLLAIGMIIYGVILYAFSNYLGVRWIAGGIVILVLLHVIVPLLQSFI
jgi:hypothetical protein